MPLISCPECQSQVSDRALACPHCGYPFAQAGVASTLHPSGRPTESQGISDTEFAEKVMSWIRDYDSVDIRVGRLVKTRVQINLDEITFGRKSLRCESIYALGWWSQTTKNIEWSQNEWTTGWIWLRSKDRSMKLTVPGNHNFGVITGAIWKLVGIRLLRDVLQRLDRRQEVVLCGLHMNGDGLALKKFGGRTETVPWKKVTHGVWDGKLRIWSRIDKTRKISLSFRHNDNVPVLDALMVLRRERLVKGVSWTESLKLYLCA